MLYNYVKLLIYIHGTQLNTPLRNIMSFIINDQFKFRATVKVPAQLHISIQYSVTPKHANISHVKEVALISDVMSIREGFSPDKSGKIYGYCDLGGTYCSHR